MTLLGPAPSVRRASYVTSRLIAVFPVTRAWRPPQQADSPVFRVSSMRYSTRLPRLVRQLRQARAQSIRCSTQKSVSSERTQTTHPLRMRPPLIAVSALMDTLVAAHLHRLHRQHARTAFGAALKTNRPAPSPNIRVQQVTRVTLRR